MLAWQPANLQIVARRQSFNNKYATMPAFNRQMLSPFCATGIVLVSLGQVTPQNTISK
jgi:hypothetical protein